MNPGNFVIIKRSCQRRDLMRLTIKDCLKNMDQSLKRNLFKKRAIFYLIIFGLPLLFPACSNKPSQQPPEHILAKIGNKSISVNEFIRRAEYTIRPPYCRMDNYIQKKIVLNSLIAEKLLALKAGEENPLTRNEEFRDYIEGRKEQAMREWLFAHDFYDKVKPDTAQARRVYSVAGRTYQIAYFSVKSPQAAQIVRKKLKWGMPFEEIFREFGGLEALPMRKVSWQEPENDAIEKALFSGPLQKEQVIGPVPADNNFFTTMKILGWTDQMAMSNQQARQRWDDVVKRFREEKAKHAYLRFVAKLMRGKRVQFDRNIFVALARIYQPIYLKSEKKKKQEFNEIFWKHKSPEDLASDSVANQIVQIIDKPLLQLDGETWTVERFLKEERIHPLVFRKKKISGNEFPEQLKLAIVDLIQDKFVAKAAEKKGYNKVNVIQRNVAMWKDHLLFMYQRDKFLKSIGKKKDFYKNYPNIFKNDLNPYIRSLQEKYSDKIGIDTDAFEKIKLTGIDMIALQKNMPFPIVVPSFPIVTTLNKLNYGKKMNGTQSSGTGK